MRRRLRATLAAVVLVLLSNAVAIAAVPRAVAAGEAEPTTSTTEAPPAPNIIPRPNTGSAPTEAGDRGGALQTTVFVIVVGGIGLIGFLIVRESRKARTERGF